MVTLYSSMSAQALKAQLKLRNLPTGGRKDERVQRLRDADWNDWMQQNDTFLLFPRFPVEIQRCIWKHSLPGPRVLSVAHTGDTEKLHFPAEHHAPNPAALTACRTSREVALSRYRPVFGNSHIYADLQGGEMVYFGPWNEDLELNEFWVWQQLGHWEDDFTPTGDGFLRFSPSVVADLERVTHIVFHFDLLKPYFPGEFGRVEEDGEYSGGRRLRRELSKFKGLKIVSLCCGGSDRFEYSHLPGQVVLGVDPAHFEEEDEEDAWSSYPREMLEYVVRNFHSIPSQKEKENGMPEVQMVEAHRISDPQHRRRSRPGRVFSSK